MHPAVDTRQTHVGPSGVDAVCPQHDDSRVRVGGWGYTSSCDLPPFTLSTHREVKIAEAKLRGLSLVTTLAEPPSH